MSKIITLNVEPWKDGWAVIKINPKRNQNMGVYFPKWGETKKDAIAAAVRYAKNHQPSRVVVYGRNDLYQVEMSYGGKAKQ
jgi:hypothetical protein